MTSLYNLVVNGIFSIIIGLFGGIGVLLPSVVKEHFFSSRQRILSFIFLVIIINAAVKFILSAFRSLIELFCIKINFLDKVIDFAFSFTAPYERGYDEGYNDGYNENVSRLNTIGKKSFLSRFWSFIKYALAFMLIYSVVMNSNW